MKRYLVKWDMAIRGETTVDAESPEEAMNMIESGGYVDYQDVTGEDEPEAWDCEEVEGEEEEEDD